MVELAKKLRKQMLAIGVEGFWLEVFNRTIEVFRDHPPENRDTDPTSMLGFLDLLSDEAERMGDTSFLQSLASAQSDLAFQVDWAAADGTQGSLDYSDLLNRSVRFNASMRAGRAFLGEDDKAARAAFERALEISEQDVLKQVDALFELTKLLRNSPTERDFQQALACGEAAVALTKDLLRLGAIDPGKQSDVTLSTSNVYLDIVTLPGIDWPEGLNRGEALGEECLDFAASVGQRARACVNLSNWRRLRKRAAEGAELLIEAASLFEASGEKSHMGAALLMYARALWEDGNTPGAVAATKRAEHVFRALGEGNNVSAAELLREEILQVETK